MASRQKEIDLAKELINKGIKNLDREIELANNLISECKKGMSLEEKKALIERISSLEQEIGKSRRRLSEIIDSLATATDEINKKKFLLLNSDRLLALRKRLDSFMDAFHKKVHKNFLGNLKGEIIIGLQSNDSSDIIELAYGLIDNILSPSITTLNEIKEEFLVIEDWLKYKHHLRELENDETDYSKSGFEKYYHATDYVSNFKNGLLLNRKEDIFFASDPATAIAQKMGFSGGGSNLTVIEFRIAKNLNDKFGFVKPHSTDSYTDANTECFYIDKNYIDEINKIIKSGNNLISIKIH